MTQLPPAPRPASGFGSGAVDVEKQVVRASAPPRGAEDVFIFQKNLAPLLGGAAMLGGVVVGGWGIIAGCTASTPGPLVSSGILVDFLLTCCTVGLAIYR